MEWVEHEGWTMEHDCMAGDGHDGSCDVENSFSGAIFPHSFYMPHQKSIAVSFKQELMDTTGKYDLLHVRRPTPNAGMSLPTLRRVATMILNHMVLSRSIFFFVISLNSIYSPKKYQWRSGTPD